MKPGISKNVIWNLAGTLAHLLAGFVVMPFLIRHLGQTGYGLWTLVASMTSYFGVLDLGTSGSVARNLAYYRSQNDNNGVNAILNSALAILWVAAGIAIVATVGVLMVFFSLFEVPQDQMAAVQWAVLLVGANLALSFPLSVSGGILWAYERFDLQNIIDIPVVALRTALTLYLIGQGHGLIALAIITFSTSLLQGLSKWSLAFWIEPRLRLGFGWVQRDAVRILFDYGVWFFLLSLARTITPQIPLTLIGHWLSVAKVAVFRIPTQLVAYADGFLISATQVLTPIATSLHANRKATEQQRLFLEGGKFSLLLAFYVLVSFCWLGEPFIRRWIGAEYSSTWRLLMILALGEFLPMSQWVSYSIILGMGKHKPLAWISLLENLTVVTLLLLLGPADLPAVCVAIAVPAMLCRGVYRLLYTCRLVQVSPWTYLRHTFAPTLGVAIPGSAIVALITSLYAPGSWLGLIAVGAAYSAVFWGVAAIGVFGWKRCKEVITW